jgi:hypothetical protein
VLLEAPPRMQGCAKMLLLLLLPLLKALCW